MPGRLLLDGRVVRRPHGRRLELVREARAALPPPAVERRVVDRPVVAAPDEDAAPAALDLLAVGDVDEGQGAREVDRGAEVDRETGRPQRPPEPDRLAEQAPPVDLWAERGADDGGVGQSCVVRRLAGQPPAPASAR